MKRIALLSSLLTAAALVAATTAGLVLAYPFTPKGNSEAFKAKVIEEFPDAQFPPQEGTVCSVGEHSFYGPTSYCFGEFSTASIWNLAEAAVRFDLFTETGFTVSLYSHTTWQRTWRRCRFRLRVPGRGPHAPFKRLHIPGELISNDNCGLGQPEQPNIETDGDMFELEAWPKIKSHKAVRSLSRTFLFSDVVPSLSHYRASEKNGVYTFTNAVGDSLRYRP
jgi:hypothetical protein